MKDKIKQSNYFGDNLINSTKKIVNPHRAQGFVVGVIVSLLANFIYNLLVNTP